jgi:hypothetical protein
MLLAELASLVRSKNAGPFTLTFDIMFDDLETYRHVLESKALNPSQFAMLYGCHVDQVRFYEC